MWRQKQGGGEELGGLMHSKVTTGRQRDLEEQQRRGRSGERGFGNGNILDNAVMEKKRRNPTRC